MNTSMAILQKAQIYLSPFIVMTGSLQQKFHLEKGDEWKKIVASNVGEHTRELIGKWNR